MKKALITGIAGQDGSYLAELLLSKGYEVHGLVRRVPFGAAENKFSRVADLIKAGQIKIHYGDVANYPTIWRLVAELQPDEVYHLAAQSHVGISFEDDFGTFVVNTQGTHYLLSAIKELKPDTKFYFAGTGEFYGKALTIPQNETTAFSPISPYSISKVSAFYWVKMFRDAYGTFACTGISFNHESPRRDIEFVTRKITYTAARIKVGLENELKLGNLDSKRDWGFAGDYVEAMWMMLQQPTPDDYVLATGEAHTVREFVEEACRLLDIELEWRGSGVEETGTDIKTGKTIIRVDPTYFRPAEVGFLQGDSSKAREKLGWKPKIGFKELVAMMLESDLKAQSQS